MPNVTATPKGMLNGEVVTEFTDVTSTTSVTYTYPIQQSKIMIENSGISDVFVTVGSYTNQRVKPDKTWKSDVVFTSFSIRSDVNSQEFVATAFQNNSEGSGSADVIARGLAKEVKERLDSTRYGIPPSPLIGVTVTASYAGPLPIEVHDGWVYGIEGTVIKRSSDYGATWETVTTTPSGSIMCIFWCPDGEVVIANDTSVWKSTGWATNPATVTWSVKVTKSAPAGVGIRRWSIDGDGNKFIATEYSGADRAESRYVWVSTDQGNTWNIVLDKLTIDPTNTSHMHGVCYDTKEDRFWLSHGHGIIRGVYYSNDNGASWTKLGGEFQPDAAPTTLTATDDGIVCGSDSGDAGIYGIARTSNPTDMEMRRTARWSVIRAGVTGFATRGFRDPRTGHVYVSFKSDFADVASVIMVGTAVAGSTVWESPTLGLNAFEYFIVDGQKVLGVITRAGVNELINGNITSLAVGTFDSGNVAGGKSLNSTAVAIGPKAIAANKNETVIGTAATTTGVDSGTAIGTLAVADTRATAIGASAQAKDDDSTAIGFSALADGANITVVGSGASTYTTANNSTVIGKGAKSASAGTAVGAGAQAGTQVGHISGTAVGNNASSASNGVAVGSSANAGSSQVAIGQAAVAAHLNSIALGKSVSTTATDQLAIGPRHIEITELSADPTAPAVNGARLFVKDNGAGKTQVCVRFNTGAVIVIATEP